jgi:Tfp pilus assembly protein FimT
MEPCHQDRFHPSGNSLVELMLVLALLGVLVTLGASSLSAAVKRQEARGTAQTAQSATAWGQLGVVWQGGEAQVSLGRGGLSVSNESGRCGGDLGTLGTPSAVTSNIFRWNVPGGVELRFLGSFASPDSGGSLYVESGGGAYRVIVRPGSGFTVRSWAGR